MVKGEKESITNENYNLNISVTIMELQNELKTLIITVKNHFNCIIYHNSVRQQYYLGTSHLLMHLFQTSILAPLLKLTGYFQNLGYFDPMHLY